VANGPRVHAARSVGATSIWPPGRIYLGRAKTDAGMREVDMLPILREELLAHNAGTQVLTTTSHVDAAAR
jgi:hypothetical protein